MPVTKSLAASCGSNSIIGNFPPYWGSNAIQDVNISNGSQVLISVKGEDGCAGQTAQFQIKSGGVLVSTISTTLNLGSAVAGGAYILEGDWIVNLNPGTYEVQLISVGGQIYQSNPSSNSLIVGTAQACNLTSAYPVPNGGVGGQTVLLTVEASGTCQGWGVTIQVVSALVGGGTVFNGSAQYFSSTSTTLQWSWTLPNLVSGQLQAPYKFTAYMGTQSLESPRFLVTGSGGGVCPNGICEAGEDPNSCPQDCTPAKPGQNQNIFYDLTKYNPFNSSNVLDVGITISTWIFNIALGVVTLIIIYSGIRFLLSRGVPGEVEKAKKALLYAIIGLAIVLIGKGFISLIASILS